MVDADWHDGYEEQAEAIDEWFTDVVTILQAVSCLYYIIIFVYLLQ